MVETLKSILPPPPHEVARDMMGDVKGIAEDMKNGMKGALDDAKSTVQELAPHRVLSELKPGKDMLPPPPPRPPRLGD